MKKLWIILVLVAVTGMLLTACGQAAPEVQVVKETVVVEKEVEKEVEKVVTVEVEKEVEKVVTVEVEKEVEVVVTPTPVPEQTIWFGSGTTLAEPYMVPLLTLGRDILAEKGITLEFVALSTDEAVEAALDRGRLDVALLSTVGLNRAVSQGLSMRYALALEMHNTFVLATGSDVTDLEQLQGKKVGIQSRTSLSIAVAEVMLREQAGLEPDEDYELILLPGSDARAAAMEAGTLDAAVLFRNVAADLANRSDGEFKVFGGLWDVLDPMLWEGLAMSEQFRANTELAQTFVDSMLEAYEQFYEGDPAELAAMKDTVPEAEPLNVEELAGDFELYQDIELFPLDGGLDQVYYDRMVDFLLEIDQLDEGQVVPYEQAVDTSVLEAVKAGE